MFLSTGIPPEVFETTIVLPWNNMEVLEKTIERRGQEIAAIISEPIMGNAGAFLPKKEYLEGMQKLAAEHGIITILDEVVTPIRAKP